MPLIHPFTCTIEDNAIDAAAGRVLPSHWNQEHVVSNGIDLPAETVTAPAADIVRLYGLKVCSKMQTAISLSRNEESAWLQTHIGRGRVGMLAAGINSSAFNTLGLGLGIITGTSTTAGISYASKYGTFVRQDILQATASATNIASWRYSATAWARTLTLSGFFVILRAGVATGASNTSSRFFVGMRNNVISAPTDVDPSTQVNQIGVGWDSADANVQIMFNDSTGTSSKINLGASWPVPVADRSEFYELQIYAPRNSTSVFVSVTELVSGRNAVAELTTDLLNASVGPIAYASVGGVSDVIGLTFGLFYSELFA